MPLRGLRTVFLIKNKELLAQVLNCTTFLPDSASAAASAFDIDIALVDCGSKSGSINRVYALRFSLLCMLTGLLVTTYHLIQQAALGLHCHLTVQQALQDTVLSTPK
eukprot:gnl/MRDRNA2_/MRDRNA2_261963_c0_seq1.p1 gnl/MRDRNA2_/MRDRNA2_261963_c0~~gnl/MRDRNA2_/MRDRNA2_261963_c0_seq1.p1  ORF type:complete len:107 (-),score=20.36 gnl/MRDRNA2_/MRDRNA2_261963_c0_seq1:165-485(-)